VQYIEYILLHYPFTTLHCMEDPELITQAIANNVRAQRAHRGLTLDALAARSGVSRGMLVQVEQGRTNPSVSTLTRIADLDQGEGRARLLVGADMPMILELWDWRLSPGQHHDGDAHPPGTREMLTVLEGELTLIVAGKSHVVGTDAAVLFTADRPHRYANQGDAELRFIMAVAEPRTAGDT
jgi:DNA-binding XRE family transcriptional regulator/quercetin dioxygenase-like cupin family protein